MAASQLQLLAQNSWMRGQEQQWARRDLFVLFFPLSSVALHFSVYHLRPPPTPPKNPLTFNHLILLFISANLSHLCPIPLPPHPTLPSKTNLIPSWPGRETETMRLAGEGRRRAEWGQEQTLVAPPQRPGRGEQGHSQVPSLEHNLHVTVVLPHHTRTQADSWSMRLKQHETHRYNVCSVPPLTLVVQKYKVLFGCFIL